MAVVPDSGGEPERPLAGLIAAPIELPVRGVDFTAKFTQTLFVRFDSKPELEQLCDSLGLEKYGAQPFDPHLSLLYKKLPVATPADVSAWEVIA